MNLKNSISIENNRLNYTKLGIIFITLLFFIFGLLIRLEFGLNFDISGDTYHRWFISAYTLETGNYVDQFANRIEISWLPGFDIISIIFIFIFGNNSINYLKIFNIVLNFCSILLFIYFYSHYNNVLKFTSMKSIVFIFLWMNPYFILISVSALPEMLMLFLFLLILTVLYQKNIEKPNNKMVLSISMLILFSGLIKIELWIGMLLLISFFVIFQKKDPKYLSKRIYLLIITFSILLGTIWFMIIKLNPLFLKDIVEITSKDLQDTAFLPFSFSIDRLFQYLVYFFVAVPYLVLGIINLFNKPLDRFSSWFSIGFLSLFTVFILFGFGTLSYRYFTLVIPFLTLEFILLSENILNNVKNFFFKFTDYELQLSNILKALTVSLMTIILIGSSLSTIHIAEDIAVLNQPEKRAGIFLKTLPVNTSKLILSDSVKSIYYSEINPKYFIGSIVYFDKFAGITNNSVIQNRIRQEIQYLVIVNMVKYFPILGYFPDLGKGLTNESFELLFTATDWENQYGGADVFVYKVL
ncbi:MAG: hypothetical protein HeimC3_51990 [Candidatus Heimdallarchaeota archaeon LC_3]|nr:MAG: hypothetical protein HeimC3_51990 [Candidatus Heimdallarchaeota archaeon LC_3]